MIIRDCVASKIEVYKFPDPTDPVVIKIKKLSKRVATTKFSPKYDKNKYLNSKNKLREYMDTLNIGQLNYWSQIILIDSRFSGATGAGAWIAVASEEVNKIARELLRNRPLFEIV